VPTSGRRLTPWIKKVLLWSVVALLVSLVVGAIYQGIPTEVDQRAAFPGPGEMVNVGDHRLHMNCVGQGSPTVVLDGGWGYTSVEWSGWVHPEVAKHTRVCAYDRAGLGWSEPGPGPPDATRVASDLHALLREASEEGPDVLVGQSIAGLYSRIYADQYPEEVAGMVLVDSTHPVQFEGSRLVVTMNKAAGVLGPLLARTGISRMFDLYPFHPELPPLQREHSDSLYYTTSHQVAMFEEMGAIPDTQEEARGRGALGEKPLVVVSASDHDAKTEALQKEFTGLSSESSMRVVKGSTHSSLVVDRDHARQTSEEIVTEVEAVRSGQPLVTR
jgi:pimeloyl-ACP methyl ester carboxylesterase